MCVQVLSKRAFKIGSCATIFASGLLYAAVDKRIAPSLADLAAFGSLLEAQETLAHGQGSRAAHREGPPSTPGRHGAVGQPPLRHAPAGSGRAIPPQLVLTAKHGSLEEMPPAVQENVRRTLALNPELRARWLGDEACGDFLRANFGGALLAAFRGERRGSYRGDICRSAVLALEGGFYVDLDVEMRVPFSRLVDNATTFVSALSEDGGVLNALLAATPGSEVMRAVLAAIEGWYGGRRQDRGDASGWMGPATLLRALRDVAARDCPAVDFSDGARLQRACGPRNQVRLYQERKLRCFGGVRARESLEECPRERREFEGLQFGIFEPGPGRTLVAWSRFASCREWGCGAGGWSETP